MAFLFLGQPVTAQEGSIIVHTGGVVVVKKDYTLSVGGKIINNTTADKFVMENDANIIQIANVANVGKITANREVKNIKNAPASMDYVYWSSPVSGQQTKGIGGFSPGTPNNRFYSYRESNDRFYETADLAFVPGRGYAVRAEGGIVSPYDKTYVFVGIPNNGDLSFPITRSLDNPVGTVHGYNLVGNPYPSNISFDELYAGNPGLIYKTAYFWTNASYQQYQGGSSYDGNNYAIWNGTGGAPPASAPSGITIPNGIIKVGQGFLVQKIAHGSEPLLFKNSYGTGNKLRVANTGTFYQREVTAKNRFWLTLLSPSKIVNTQLIGYVAGATDGYEQNYDAEAFDDYSDLFYSILADKKLVIQGRSQNFSQEDNVALGINFFQAGPYTISLNRAEGIFESSQFIYLKDKQTGTTTNLSQSSYVFTATEGDNSGRFEIIYKPETVLAIDDSVKKQLIIYRDYNNFVIQSPKYISEIQVYDSSGKLTIVLAPNNTKAILEASGMPHGIYFLKIKTKDGDIVSRKIIK